MIDETCRTIVERLELNVFVETGTDKGETIAEVSRWFAALDPNFGTIVGTVYEGARSYRLRTEPVAYPVFRAARDSRYRVHSVDLDEHSYRAAVARFRDNPNIRLYLGSSDRFLRAFLAAPRAAQGASDRYLFFLDAHWGDPWPLRGEIEALGAIDPAVIVIDDFMVPGRSDPSRPHGDFGFDVYRGQILDWHYVHDLFAGSAVRVFYPRRPNRDRRGWVVIVRGYAASELSFFAGLELDEVGATDPAHVAAVPLPFRARLDGTNLLRSVVPPSILRALHRAYVRWRP